MFPSDSVIRRVDSEAVMLLGGGRALLMQVAHPGVALAVLEHGDFQANPLARLQRTLLASYAVVFGNATQAERAASRVAGVHERVSGPGYQADDPDLLLWVHATLVDTALEVHRRFLQPLRPDEAECYYEQSASVCAVFGVPRDRQPADLDAFRVYVRSMVDELAATLSPESRRAAADVLHPRVPLVAEPVMAIARELTAGLLPRPLRRGYGLTWDPARRAALAGAERASRSVLPRVPSPLRRVPARALAGLYER